MFFGLVFLTFFYLSSPGLEPATATLVCAGRAWIEERRLDYGLDSRLKYYSR